MIRQYGMRKIRLAASGQPLNAGITARTPSGLKIGEGGLGAKIGLPHLPGRQGGFVSREGWRVP